MNDADRDLVAAEMALERPPAPRYQGEWTVAFGDELCGYCGRRIDEGEALQLLTQLKKPRCVACKTGDVDEDAVATVRARRAALLEQAQAAPAVLASAPTKPTYRHRPSRGMKPISEVAGALFDPRAAAANDRND